MSASGSSCIRFRGVPIDSSLEMVASMFGTKVVDCFIMHNASGISQGEGFVRFESEADAAAAMKDRICVPPRRRPLDLFPASCSEMEASRRAAHPFTVLKLRGLVSSRRDIFQILQPLQGKVSRIDVVRLPDGTPTDEQFLTFTDPEAALRASQFCYSYFLRYTSVEVFASTEDERNTVIGWMRFPFLPWNRRQAVRLRGLPLGYSTEQDVAAFLSGINILRNGIHMIVNPDGSSTRECIVELQWPVDVHLALQRNSKCIAFRYIEVMQCTSTDFYLLDCCQEKDSVEPRDVATSSTLP